MNKLTNLLGMAIIGLIFTSCSSDNDDPLTPDLGNGDGAIVSISLNNTMTKADLPDEDGVGDENKISTLDFYVFKSDGSHVQTNSFTTQSTYKFVISTDAPDLVGMNFLVGINQDEITSIPADGTAFAYVKSQLSSSETFENYVKGDNAKGNTTAVPSLFAMSGWVLNQNVTAPTSGNNSPVTSFTISVSRLVSKVENPVENSSGVDVNVVPAKLEELFNTGVTDATFALKGYVLVNGYDKTDAFYTWTSESDWTGWSRTGKTYLPSLFDTNGAYTSVYAGTSADDMFLSGDKVMYLYENQPERDASEPTLYYKKNTVNAFIIKGELKCIGGPDDGTTVTRYWRANLIPDDNHTVLRNTIYRMSIDGVNTIGYGTPEDAEKEVVPQAGNASVNISINVAKWRVKSTGAIL